MKLNLRCFARLAMVATLLCGSAFAASAQTSPRTNFPPVPPVKRVDAPLAVQQSLRPMALPAPGNMPGGYLREIQNRGRLQVCSYSDIKLFSYADPLQENKLVGFDVDIANKVAAAIFGTAEGHISFVRVTSKDRIPFVSNGQCDIVVATMTINADRKKQVDFSEVYFDAGQRVAVLKPNPATGIHELSGQRVCAPIGSTSLANIKSANPYAVLVEESQYTDCLRAVQEGRADAISTDDVILAGLASQDPWLKLVGDQFTHEPYGIAVSKKNPDLTRFVNAVLQQAKKDGSWKAIYSRWLGFTGPAPEPPVGKYVD